MSVAVLIIDSRVPYPRTVEAGGSLLAQPLGTGTVLDELLHVLEGVRPLHVWVLTAPDVAGANGEEPPGWPPCAIPIRKPSGLLTHLRQLESSDVLLVVEPRFWPLEGHDVAELLKEVATYRGVTHVVGVGSAEDDARERVVCDPSGDVQRVQRLYGGMHWHQGADNALICSVMQAGLMPDEPFESLVELRRLLSAHGTLCQDLPFRSAVVDLTHEQAFLLVHEKTIEEAVARTAASGYRRCAEGVLVATDARIDPEARLIPPVVVQGGACVEAGANVIGPTVIGARTRVGRDAIVAQSVIWPDAEIPAGRTVQARVSSRVCDDDAETDAWERAVLSLPHLMPSADRGTEIGEMTGMGPGGFSRRAQLALKRLTDLVASGLSLIVLSPLLLIVAVLIKLDSPGPVFFVHRRERRGGEEFPCLKFRTMTADAHHMQRALYQRSEVDGPQFKIRQDPRVTHVGRWLRATNIDELPQLINVVLGHMSLVGPRPSPFRENQICVPWRRARLSVRPGVTGLWQICRDGAAGGGFHQWIYYDILYVRHFSYWLDVKILLATVLSLAFRRTVPLSWLISEAARGQRDRRLSVAAPASGGGA